MTIRQIKRRAYRGMGRQFLTLAQTNWLIDLLG